MSSALMHTELSAAGRTPHALPSPIERLKYWLPVDAVIKDSKPVVEWLDMSAVVFSEPFFQMTVDRVRRECVGIGEATTEFDALVQLEKVSDSLSPTGFIFHTSRSGSTLVANSCRALEDSLVISEAPIVPKIIGRLFTDTHEDTTRKLLYQLFLRSAVSALGQRRLGERHFFLKFTNTCFLQFNSFRKIWPRVPALFLYRDPIEVMVSNLRTLPSWLNFKSDPIVSALIIGVERSELDGMSHEEYCARALGKYYAAAETMADSKTLLMDYEELMPESLVRIIRFFGVEPSAEETGAILRTARQYSKDPKKPFHADSSSKRAEASMRVKELAAEWALPAYRRLQAHQRHIEFE